MGEAAKGSREIVQNIIGVAQAAQNTASGATETQAAAQELARLATELEIAVKQFRVDGRNFGTDAILSKQTTQKKLSGIKPQPTSRPAGSTLHTL